MISRMAEYFREKEEVVAVYLFGSYAAGKMRKGSDVDLGILFAGSDRRIMRQKSNQYMLELARMERMDIHPVVMNGASQELLRQIFAKGLCIHIKDQLALARFRMIQFGMIADFDVYRKQIQNGLIKKLMGGGSVDRP